MTDANGNGTNGAQKRGRGRPTKRTPECESTILEGLRIGLSYDTCASLAGITVPTLRDWRNNDEVFSSQCLEARADGIKSMSALLVTQAKNGSVRATEFWLKHRAPEFHELRDDLVGQEELEPDRRYI